MQLVLWPLAIYGALDLEEKNLKLSSQCCNQTIWANKKRRLIAGTKISQEFLIAFLSFHLFLLIFLRNLNV